MKKQWLPLVFATFLVLAPTASAGDGSSWVSFQELLSRLVELFAGDEAEVGLEYPPNGQPNGSDPGDEPELGLNYPPNG